MSPNRSSSRQSWNGSDAARYATELCQRSFESEFTHMLPSLAQQAVQTPPPAYLPNDKTHYNRTSVQPSEGRSTDESHSWWLAHKMDGDSSRTLSASSIWMPGDLESSDHRNSSASQTKTPRAFVDRKLGIFQAAEKDDLDSYTAAHPLPLPNRQAWTQKVRYHWFSSYRKLWSLAIIVNLVTIGAVIPLLMRRTIVFSYCDASTATGANLLVAVLMRQEHIINLLFRLACLIPSDASLSIRKRAAKVYSYGGLHAGCGVSSLLWYILTVVLIFTRFEGTYEEFKMLAGLAIPTLAIFMALILLSHPYIRRRKHDCWECSHRFGGWISIGLVWTQAILLTVIKARQAQQPIGTTLAKSAPFWFLIIITSCLVYPWLRLRRRKVRAEVLSSHAVRLYFSDEGNLPLCVGYKLSHSPLTENHGFATIANSAEEGPGYSIVVSNNGDFTKDMIKHPPSHIYTRGAPVTGVMRVATLFQRIVIVTTGSGIGPALSFMNVRSEFPMRVIWSARSPMETYGPDIINSVLRADREAIIVDTKKTGYPNLPALTYATYESFRAEAVLVISNPALTGKVVFEMESRGVPSFGPIFDS